ncbi:unnamed protein product [Staurois parvus]|uniref:Uncharacterized protein n=1 Tax=Staurois parvus TaxID=386267 RepID=A0ABN9GU51_9NEOB|nr:unnamed protein product [Staurois parvus]
MQAGQRTKQQGQNKMTVSNIFKFAASSSPHKSRTSRRLQGPGHGSRMPASVRGDGRGCCRGCIVGAKDKVSAAGNP